MAGMLPATPLLLLALAKSSTAFNGTLKPDVRPVFRIRAYLKLLKASY